MGDGDGAPEEGAEASPETVASWAKSGSSSLMLDLGVKGAAIMESATRFMIVLADLILDATNMAGWATWLGIVVSRHQYLAPGFAINAIGLAM